MPFIALEGGEGVGKTTQRKLLEERLPTLYPEKKFVFTREPGGTPFAEKIRELILSDAAKDADGATMFGLFAAARADHVRNFIRPHMSDGFIVITDRFAGSSFAYQACAQENPIPEIYFLEHCDAIGLMPNLTLILDMDARDSLDRLPGRNEVQNHFDNRGPDFQNKLRAGYRRYAELLEEEGRKVAIINAAEPIEDVHIAILEAIRKVL